MIISLKKNFIFAATPKCASTSLNQILLEDSDILAVGDYDGTHYPLSKIRRKFALPFAAAGLSLDDFFTFSFIREPVDWLCSFYNFQCRSDISKPWVARSEQYVGDISFPDYVIRVCEGTDPTLRLREIQHWMFLDDEGEKSQLADLVIPYDDIRKIVPELIRERGFSAIPDQVLNSKRNVSEERRAHPDMLDDAMKERIYKRFPWDAMAYAKAKEETQAIDWSRFTKPKSQSDKTLDDFTKAMRRYAPERLAATYREKFFAYKEKGENERADFFLQAAYDMPSTKAEHFHLLSKAYTEKGDLERAKELQKFGLRLGSIEAADICQMARIARRQGKYEEAIDYAEKAARHHPTDPRPLNLLSSLYTDLNDIETAERIQKQALTLHKDNPSGLYNLSTIMLADERTAAALKACQKAVDLNPKNPAFRQGLARIFMKLERWEDAITHFSIAAQIVPKNIGIPRQLARCYQELGQLPQALTVMAQAGRARTNKDELNKGRKEQLTENLAQGA